MTLRLFDFLWIIHECIKCTGNEYTICDICTGQLLVRLSLDSPQFMVRKVYSIVYIFVIKRNFNVQQ